MDHLQTEARNPNSANLDELTPLQIVRLMAAEDAKVIPAVASQAEAIALAIEVIAERLHDGGRLVYAGAGTSGRLGVLDATECPPTFNAEPGQVIGLIAGGPAAVTRAVEGAEDHPEFGEADLKQIHFSNRDVLVGIATSGRTPYVLGGLRYARSVGAFTVGVSCNVDSEMIPLVDVAITPVVGPEILSGSTRLKAGTATKLVLNMLSTGAMVRLGKTYGNLMIDLRATNEKLKARTNRIVRLLTHLDATAADDLLRKCDRELKTALVAHLADLSPAEARVRLRTENGRVGRALAARPVAYVNGTAKKSSNGEEPDLVLGIDGGGTNTVALLARRQPGSEKGWTVLGRGEAGPSNLQAVGANRTMRSLDEAVSKAFTEAHLARRPVRAACLGLAGVGRPGDDGVVQDWASRVGLARKVEVHGDAPLLLAAGTPQGWGVAVIAGTGSMAYGATPDGRTTRAGGWGYLLGDEGSGYVLALAGLQAVTRALDDCGPPTRLTKTLLARLGVTQPHDLVGLIYRGGMDRAALAALAPLVLEAADADDAVAGQILDQAAEQLARMVAAVTRKLDLDRTIPLALAGGLLLSSARYREGLTTALGGLGLVANPVALVPEPAEGAVRLALRALAESAVLANGVHTHL
jgi:N-acetylmuramic acid 6-phosphate etherase